nr:MAG TPA: hypothetical protein [Bacteriophage sp.]
MIAAYIYCRIIYFSFSCISDVASYEVLMTLKLRGLFVSSPISKSTLGLMMLKS